MVSNLYADQPIELFQITCIKDMRYFELDSKSYSEASNYLYSDTGELDDKIKLLNSNGLYLPENLSYECSVKNMERASNHMFDEASNDTTKEYAGNPPAECVPASKLGFDNGESIYDDIDDFDDFVSLSPFIETGRSGVKYRMIFEVDYVNLSGGHFVHAANPTYNKRMKISIYDNYATPLLYKYNTTGMVKDTLSMSFVYSYWYKN